MLRDSAEIAADPVFVNAKEELVPDPASYSDWFGQVDDRRRKLAVGARRYSTVQEITGGRPAWEDFVDPATGRLLGDEELRQESLMERVKRSAEVRRLMDERRRKTEQVAQFGFELPG